MPPPAHPLRPAAINLYKRLHRLGRDYPSASYNFLGKLRDTSRRVGKETEEREVRKWLDIGEFVYKGEQAERGEARWSSVRSVDLLGLTLTFGMLSFKQS